MGFFGALSDIDNKGTPAMPLNKSELRRSPKPGFLEMAVRAAWHTVRSPISMTDAVMRSMPSVYRMAQDALTARGSPGHIVPETRFNTTVEPQKMWNARSFKLDDLKAVRALVPEATINDAVLAVCGGALRCYLEHHDELPEESLVAWVPINARDALKCRFGRAGERHYVDDRPVVHEH